METIELLADDDYFVQVLLEGKLYFLYMSWNSEARYWTMAIRDYNKNILASGLKVVPNFPLIGRYYIEGMPPGEFVAISKSTEIAQSDFVDGYAEMVYVTEAEL